MKKLIVTVHEVKTRPFGRDMGLRVAVAPSLRVGALVLSEQYKTDLSRVMQDDNLYGVIAPETPVRDLIRLLDWVNKSYDTDLKDDIERFVFDGNGIDSTDDENPDAISYMQDALEEPIIYTPDHAYGEIVVDRRTGKKLEFRLFDPYEGTCYCVPQEEPMPKMTEYPHVLVPVPAMDCISISVYNVFDEMAKNMSKDDTKSEDKIEF